MKIEIEQAFQNRAVDGEDRSVEVNPIWIYGGYFSGVSYSEYKKASIEELKILKTLASLLFPTLC